MAEVSIGDFRFQLKQLNEALKTLDGFILAEVSIDDIYLAKLPRITKEQEKERFLQHYQRHLHHGQLQYAPFPVQNERNTATCKSHFLHHLQSFYTPVDMSSRFVGRLPGFVFLSTTMANELISLIDQVNHEKKVLLETIQKLGVTPKKRYERLHAAEPGFMTVHATRALSWREGKKVKSINFGWEHRQSMKRLTKDEVLKLLEASQENGTGFFAGIDTEEYFHEAVENEIKTIKGYSAKATFMQRRSLPPTPIVRIRTSDERDVKVGSEVTQRERFVAHSPLILINCEAPKKYALLNDYPGYVQEEPEDNSLIIPRMHLYQDN